MQGHFKRPSYVRLRDDASGPRTASLVEQMAAHLKPGGMMLHIMSGLGGFEGSQLPVGALQRLRLPLALDGVGASGEVTFVEFYDCNWRKATLMTAGETSDFLNTRVWEPRPSVAGEALSERAELPNGRLPVQIQLPAA